MAPLIDSPEVLEIAQAQKKPKLPSRPEPTTPEPEQNLSLQVKKWAEEMLASEAKLEATTKALFNMLVFGGKKETIEATVNTLRPALEAGHNLRRYADSRMDQSAIILYTVALESLLETLPRTPAKRGLIINPFTLDGDGARVLGQMNGSAKNAVRALKALKPLLLELSEQAPKQPPRQPISGPVVA